MSPRNKFLVILAVLFVGALAFYYFTSNHSTDLVLVGTVDANQVMVSSKIPGRIEKLAVDEGSQVHAGDLIAINGSTGDVTTDDVPLVPARIEAEFETILAWADEFRTLGVRANADNPEDATRARGRLDSSNAGTSKNDCALCGRFASMGRPFRSRILGTPPPIGSRGGPRLTPLEQSFPKPPQRLDVRYVPPPTVKFTPVVFP